MAWNEIMMAIGQILDSVNLYNNQIYSLQTTGNSITPYCNREISSNTLRFFCQSSPTPNGRFDLVLIITYHQWCCAVWILSLSLLSIIIGIILYWRFSWPEQMFIYWTLKRKLVMHQFYFKIYATSSAIKNRKRPCACLFANIYFVY